MRIDPDGRHCFLMCSCNSVCLVGRTAGRSRPKEAVVDFWVFIESYTRALCPSPLVGEDNAFEPFFCPVGVHLAGCTTSIVPTRTHTLGSPYTMIIATSHLYRTPDNPVKCGTPRGHYKCERLRCASAACPPSSVTMTMHSSMHEGPSDNRER